MKVKMIAIKDRQGNDNRVENARIYQGDNVIVERDRDFPDLYFVSSSHGICEMTYDEICTLFVRK